MDGVTKLLIIGDSFCKERNKDVDWPHVLANKLGLEIHGAGFGGQGFWSQRRWLMNNINKFKKDTLVIFCHSEWSRLPCENDWAITTWVLDKSQQLKDGQKIPSNSELQVVDPDGSLTRLLQNFYLSELYVDDFYKWAMQSWFKELTVLHDQFYNFIHLTGFREVRDILEATPIPGITVTTSLGGLAQCEDNRQFVAGPDTRRNHLSAHNNIQLAEFLESLIVNHPDPITKKTCITNLSNFEFKTTKFMRNVDRSSNNLKLF